MGSLRVPATLLWLLAARYLKVVSASTSEVNAKLMPASTGCQLGAALGLDGVASAPPEPYRRLDVVFSRPPGSKTETNALVYWALAGIYFVCAIVLLVSGNLDQNERKKRKELAEVPEDSMPCIAAEQCTIDEYLLFRRGCQSWDSRRRHWRLGSYILHQLKGFPGAFIRQHLAISIAVSSIPTFTRLKRAFLIVVHLHACMLFAGLAYNILEHDKPNGKYEAFSCNGSLLDSACTSTIPLSFIVAVLFLPVFRLTACRQLRLTCFVRQSHPSRAPFPVNVRKFARIPSRSPWESVLCMRNAYERRQTQILQSRTLGHRMMSLLWRSTQPMIRDYRFYSFFPSCFIVLVLLAFVVLTAVYVLVLTAYLEDDIVYHWLAWVLTMFFSSVFILEPLYLFFSEVLWSAAVMTWAQHWGFGPHALAATTRYKDAVRQVDQFFYKNVRIVGASRIERWWLAVLDMYRMMNDSNKTSIKTQAIRKKMVHGVKYVKERKWCMRLDVLNCHTLTQVDVDGLMSPFIKLQCDGGNPLVMQTRVAWDSGQSADFNECFIVDVKESTAIYLSVWTKNHDETEDFIGRSCFEFSRLTNIDLDRPEGLHVQTPLHDIQHGDRNRSRTLAVRGYVNIRVRFIDPLKETAGSDETSWMLPRHRMQFALSKMGGRTPISRMLGNLGATGATDAAAWEVTDVSHRFSIGDMSTPYVLGEPSGVLRLDGVSVPATLHAGLSEGPQPARSLNANFSLNPASRPASQGLLSPPSMPGAIS